MTVADPAIASALPPFYENYGRRPILTGPHPSTYRCIRLTIDLTGDAAAFTRGLKASSL